MSKAFYFMVGMTRFELATSPSLTECATPDKSGRHIRENTLHIFPQYNLYSSFSLDIFRISKPPFSNYNFLKK